MLKQSRFANGPRGEHTVHRARRRSRYGGVPLLDSFGQVGRQLRQEHPLEEISLAFDVHSSALRNLPKRAPRIAYEVMIQVVMRCP